MTTSDTVFLTSSAPVPIDRPFTTAWAKGHGVDRRRLRAWLDAGLLLSPVHGVVYAAQLPDSLDLRLECLRLVVPEHAVVTDRTAAWLLGAPMVLAPNSHLQVPPVDLFLLPGGRIRRGVVRSGQRELFTSEIIEVGGIRVTSHMRTMCDLGMKLPRKQAFAAMCMMLKICDFSLDEIRRQADARFKGHRWVRQLRVLIPLLDPRFESPGECILAIIWHETPGLPPFEPQWEVVTPQGAFRLDLAVPELLWAGEYNGAEFHGEDRAEADEGRRSILSGSEGWQFGVFEAIDVQGTGKRASDRLVTEIAEARRTFASRRRVVI